jgi:hypothetical protein
VIGPTGAVRVMVATKLVDFRKGAEGLAALAREVMEADPFDGAIYVFRAQRFVPVRERRNRAEHSRSRVRPRVSGMRSSSPFSR